jgi:hypothetical protein
VKCDGLVQNQIPTHWLLNLEQVMKLETSFPGLLTGTNASKPEKKTRTTSFLAQNTVWKEK